MENKDINNELVFPGELVKQRMEFLAPMSPEERAKRDLKLERLAYIDSLTGLPKRELVEEKIKILEGILKRTTKECSVIFIDIDDLKDFNTEYGHEEANRYIKRIAEILQNSVKRNLDIVGRWTRGDEFIIILPKVDESGILNVGDRISLNLQTLETRTSLSMGASVWNPKQHKNLINVIEEADQAMYKSKEAKGKRINPVGLIFFKEINKDKND